MRLLLLCALAPVLACASAGSSSTDRAAASPDDAVEVRRLHQSYADALIARDSVTLRRILAEDFRTTVSEGRVLGREEDIAPVLSGRVAFDSARLDSVTVDVFGDAAIVRGIFVYRARVGDNAFAGRERFTDVYLKRDGQWRVVSSHNSRVR